MTDIFTIEIQLRILAWFCLDKEDSKYWVEYLEEELFEFDSLKWLATCIKESYKKFNRPPSTIVIGSDYVLTGADFDDQDKLLYDSFLELLEDGFEEEEYIADIFSKFIRSHKLRVLLYDNEAMKDEGDWGGLREALRANEPVLSLDVLNTEELFTVKTFAELFNQGEAMPTGLPLIDDPQGIAGLHKKEMMLVLADTNVGKSLLMTYIGGRVLEAGFRVLHISLEMSVARIMVRYCATLDPDTKISIDDIEQLNKPEVFVRYLAELKEKYHERFFLYELPTGIATMQDIERLIDHAEPDIVILDYLDLIKPVAKRDARRFEVAELAMVARGQAVKGNFHILSASQTNRSGHDSKIIDVNMASEDYDKMRTADDVIGLGQGKDDGPKDEVVLFIAKARNAKKKGAARYRVDYPHVRYLHMGTELLSSKDIVGNTGQSYSGGPNQKPGNLKRPNDRNY